MMAQGLEIAFFGPSLTSARLSGAAAYYRGVIRALHERGHRITFYEPYAYSRRDSMDIEDPDWASVVVYPPTREGVRQALRLASGADLLIKTSGAGELDGMLGEEALKAGGHRTKVVYWDIDAKATLSRMRRDPQDPFIRLVPRYDLVVTYGGGAPVIKGYKEFGARFCVPIYNALDPSEYYPVPCDPRFMADLSFLGNRLPDREQGIDEFYMRPARMLRNKSFILGGAGWDGKKKPFNVRYVGHVDAADHNGFYCSAKAVLNVEGADSRGYSPATRIFEAAGAGACIITDYWEGIGLFLEPDKEILVARDGEEVADILRRLEPSRAGEIGQAALARVLAEHTYAHRAAQFEMAFGESKGAKCA